MKSLTELVNSVTRSKIGKSLIGLTIGAISYAGAFGLSNKSYAQTFDPQINLSVGAYPLSVAVGDANNDGYNDIITANQISDDISFLRWNRTNFDSSINLFAGSKPTGVVIADVDNDGKNEVVTANYTGNNVSLLRWNGNRFNSPLNFPTAPYPHSVAVGDANNDGRNDIVTAHTVNGTISLLLGNGNGFDLYSTLKVGNYPTHVVIADADNDGDNDIVTANSAHDGGGVSNISLIKWNGANFDPQIQLTAGSHIDSVAVGDADNDKYNDIMCTNRNDNNVSLLRWNGTGFNSPVNFPTGTYPMSVAIGDANNDGYNDIVTANSTSNNISFLRWNGTGFNSQIIMPAGKTPYQVAIGDANNDGYNDIITANANSNNISLIYWNKPIPTPRTDVEIISPHGGETWEGKSIQDVHWKTNIPTAGTAVRFELWDKDDRMADLGYAWSPSGDATDYIIVPLMFEETTYNIRAYSLWDSKFWGKSNNITITGKPIKLDRIIPHQNQNEADNLWTIGSLQSVLWEANPDIAGTGVKFELWRYNSDAKLKRKVRNLRLSNQDPNYELGLGWDPSGKDVSTFIVPNVQPGSNYKVRVISGWDPQYWDESEFITIKK